MVDNVERRRIVLGITGSIAAYKSAELARLLVTRGYDVRVLMTEAACQFITPATLEALTGNPASVSFWKEQEPGQIGHIALSDWAEAIVVAPATADTIAKIAYGFADSPLTATILASTAPLVIAPAMNVNMYANPQTQENIAKLRSRGAIIVDPEEGDLACGWKGTGRLASPREIFAYIRRSLTGADLAGKKFLVTTGPTREAVDPVRFISNRSSGKMGIALAMEAFRRGADVTLVHGPVTVNVPRGISCHPVTSALEMNKTVLSLVYPTESAASPYDVVIMAAAVSDYRPAELSSQKIKKSTMPGSLELVPNPDTLKELGAKKGSEHTPTLVGFAVETGEVEDLLNEVRRKLEAKNADIIVGNKADDAFEGSTNHVWIASKHGRIEEVSMTFKSRVATRIIDAVVKL